MNPQFPQRVKTILDDAKLRLSADPLPGGTGRPSIQFYYSGTSNPRVDVYTNVPNDKDNGRIRGDLDLPTFFDFLELIRELASNDAIPEKPYVIENTTKPWDKANNRPGKDMVVVTRLIAGKDDKGRIYIALTSYDNERPKIRFYFGTGFFHSLGLPNGTKLPDDKVSRIRAMSFVNMMGQLMGNVASRDWKPKEDKQGGKGPGGGGGGGYNNRGQSGAAPAAPAASGGYYDDDLPI